jgi:ketosteroid isomerase-like protein
MTHQRFVGVGLALALLALGACRSAQHDGAADAAAVRQVLAEISSTFNAREYEAMLALYREDVIVSATGAPDTIGRTAWRERLKGWPTGVAMNLRFDTQELEIVGDLAYERGTFVVTAPDAAGAPQALFEGRHIHIFKRDPDGAWRGWRLFEILDKSLPTPSATAAN